MKLAPIRNLQSQNPDMIQLINALNLMIVQINKYTAINDILIGNLQDISIDSSTLIVDVGSSYLTFLFDENGIPLENS